MFAVGSWVSVVWPTADVYIHPILDFVEACALASFFLLMCEWISPSREQRDIFFAAKNVPNKKHPEKSQNGAKWFKVCTPCPRPILA